MAHGYAPACSCLGHALCWCGLRVGGVWGGMNLYAKSVIFPKPPACPAFLHPSRHALSRNVQLLPQPLTLPAPSSSSASTFLEEGSSGSVSPFAAS